MVPSEPRKKEGCPKHLYWQCIVHPVTQNRATLTDRKKIITLKKVEIYRAHKTFQQPILKQSMYLNFPDFFDQFLTNSFCLFIIGFSSNAI